MVYVDTTVTPEAGYTYINSRQIYDVVAGAMTTHPAWDFVEFVDAVSAPNTFRRYVWKCNVAQSGLVADFFVVFQVPFTTATGATLGWHTGTTVKVYMGETYSAGVLGKFASGAVSITLAADLTNPATFPLATYTQPASIWEVTAAPTNAFGNTNPAATSVRFWCLVAKDSMVLSRGCDYNGAPQTYIPLYVGAYETVLGAADPFPIIVLGSCTWTSPYPGGGATRAPTFTPATAYTDAFTAGPTINLTTTQFPGVAASWATPTVTSNVGSLGNPADTGWMKSAGGPFVSRLIIAPGCVAGSRSTKGLFRGYLKNIYGGTYTGHSFGDTFVINGKVHVGTGYSSQGPLVDTEAL